MGVARLCNSLTKHQLHNLLLPHLAERGKSPATKEQQCLCVVSRAVIVPGATMTSLSERMLKFRADVEPLMAYLMDRKFPSGSTENQKRSLRRQRDFHQIKGRVVSTSCVLPVMEEISQL